MILELDSLAVEFTLSLFKGALVLGLSVVGCWEEGVGGYFAETLGGSLALAEGPFDELGRSAGYMETRRARKRTFIVGADGVCRSDLVF